MGEHRFTALYGFRGAGNGAITGYGTEASGGIVITTIVSGCTGLHGIQCTARVEMTGGTMGVAMITAPIDMMMIDATTVTDLSRNNPQD
ncbi:MAG: hypothetical protein B7X28_02725, partial [Halothiobacillus sp. 13-55-253]